MGKEKKTKLDVIEHYMIKKHGLFNFRRGFKAVSSWLSDHNYDFIEKAHSEKVGSSGRTLESSWVAERRVTDYVKFSVSVDIWLRDMTDVAVEKDGKKVTVNRGRVEFIFNASMEKNYANKFGERKFGGKPGSFSNFLREIYEKYIVKSEMGDFEDKLFTEVVDWADSVKAGLSVD